jgi:hypothetical protein
MASISGGDKLEFALARIAHELSQGGTLRVGFLERATYPDGKPVAMIAAFNEYGTRTIPPRPFFRNMIAAKSGDWPAGIATQLRVTRYNVALTLRRTGEVIRGQLQQSIRETNSPPLAPSTIARKGFAKPLIDTGHMLNSVDYEVNVR